MQWLTAKRISTFTNKPYAGNPSWVVLGVDIGADEKVLLKLASELSPASDTVFVFPLGESADIYLRFFSQSEEMTFSGHGTIAAYLGLQTETLIPFREPITLVRQKTKTGIQHLELRVREKRIERVTVSLPVPQFISTPHDIKAIARLLGIPPIDITETTHPIGIVVLSGCTDIIVPVKSFDTLRALSPNFGLMKMYCERFQVTGVVAYTLETLDSKNAAHLRHFAPAVGINEEPVSGGSSAALGCYLVQNRIVPSSEMTRLIMEQGHSMNRPGVVYIHVHTYKNQIMKLTFGGQGITTFEGRILLPED